MAEAEPKTAPKAAAPKAAAPKRKAPAKRKPAAKRKAPAKRKPAAKAEAKVEKGFAKLEKSASELTSKAKETGRSAFLAGLGCYGVAFDRVQDRIDTAQSRFEARRKEADKVYQKLVKRGEKLEKDTKKAIDGIDFDGFESFADKSKLEAGLNKARARFEDLKSSASARFAS